VLLQGEQRDAALNFDTYQILQRQTERRLTVA